jgi:hypothetical protein
MKHNENIPAYSTDLPTNESTMPEMQSKPSPELAGFLELVGRALAQAWIQQTTTQSFPKKSC